MRFHALVLTIALIFAASPALVADEAVSVKRGKSLYEISALFGSEQLHEPNIQEVMLSNALQCLGPALEGEDEELKQQALLIKEEIDKESE